MIQSTFERVSPQFVVLGLQVAEMPIDIEIWRF